MAYTIWPVESIETTTYSLVQDYIANPSTIDMAYNVLIDHALAESDRRMNIPANTFQPRARPLFQYRHYRINFKCKSVDCSIKIEHPESATFSRCGI
ncbi:hypothetical protein HU200_065691 [Digitaria exilis]|uniref:Uncharacterized protein n=1 Tax=Digitaria exilis TaxID=1010633 RepID=A0A834ZY83_9POAL|nr:hypothetical protein HU200_065691 [Digitaria exilis]